MTKTSFEDFFVVIPAGGSGSRLWPLSRADAPKFLHDLTGNGKTLLRSTWDRLTNFVPLENVYVVTGEAHRKAVEEQLPDLAAGRLLTEPSSKDSAAAIGLAVSTIRKDFPAAVIGSFAADHVISDDLQFQEAVGQAVESGRSGYVVTIGVRPTEPSTAFGYIKAVSDRVSPEETASVVTNFVEKPDYETAKGYLASGDYFWNAGMFIAQASVWWELIEENRPGLAAGLAAIADMRSSDEGADTNGLWESFPRDAIDYVIAEPAAAAGRMRMVIARFGWDDVGDFAALANIHQKNQSGDVAILGSNAKVVSQDSSGVVVSQSRRVVSLVGVHDIVVVDTPDALLVTTKQHAQEVKRMVEHLKLRGLDDVL